MLLTKEEVSEYALKTGFIYEMICDTPGCGKLIRPGELVVVLKWKNRTDGLETLMGRIPLKIRCMTCEYELHPRPEAVKVKGAGRNSKAVDAKTASEVTIDPVIRKVILKVLKHSPEGIPVKEFVPRLRKVKIVREATKKVLRTTIRGMKKLKMFRRSKGMFLLSKEKKMKRKIKK